MIIAVSRPHRNVSLLYRDMEHRIMTKPNGWVSVADSVLATLRIHGKKLTKGSLCKAEMRGARQM